MRIVTAHRSSEHSRRRDEALERARSFFASLPLDDSDAARVEAETRAGLAEIDERIFVDVIDDAERRTVALSARGERALRPLLDAIALVAPQRDARRIVSGRPPLSVDRAIECAQRELDLDLSDTRVRAGIARGHLIELAVYSGVFPEGPDERAGEAAELLCESVLGERVFDDWIGELRTAPLPRKSLLPVVGNDDPRERSLPLAALADTVAAAVRGISEGLPERPLWQHRDDEDAWTMFEIEPEIAYDYASQDDLAIATTRTPELLKCFLRGQPVSSLRFSRHGETFAYLKLDAERLDTEARLRLRGALEDAIGPALARDGLGAVVGNGLGVRYAYLNLAIANLDAAVDRVIDVARDNGAPERAWLLFMDSDLSDEWIGIWDDAPAPLL